MGGDLTFLIKSVAFVKMFENDSSAAVEGLVPEDREVSLQQDASEVVENAHNTYVSTWAFVGQHAMPNCEHLIPFRI